VILLLALAGPAHAGARDAEAAERAGDWVGAAAAWEACAAGPPSGEQRRCAARVDVLRPQAADGYRGWAELEAVRRDYRTLGSDAALARIEAALSAEPDGPAAPEQRLWLVNEYTRRGDEAKAAPLRTLVHADPGVPEAARAWVDRSGAIEADAARRERIALGCAAPAVLFAAAAARGPGPWRWRPAAAAAALLGVFPTVYAWAWGGDDGAGFARTGLVCTLAVLSAARAPAWLAGPGTLGAIGVVAWWNGWYPSVGL
jgi:hypothetical protein